MMDVKWVYIVIACFVIHSNQRRNIELSSHDPTSYSRPEFASIKHLSLALRVDFGNKVFHGVATLYMKVHTPPISFVPLDINNLTIHDVYFKKHKLQHHISDSRPFVGSCLIIYLPDTNRHDHSNYDDSYSITLKINYTTHPSAAALMWMEPRETSGKVFPYVFSQCSPINARSLLPCQDTPSVKFTYDAVVDAPRGMTVLMSALIGEFSWTFYQPLPITSNIFAIAIGHLKYKWIGPRSRVWSEAVDLERNAKEFSMTEKYLEIAEGLCTSYEWTVYDILVVPPMFPYAAMENPCITFVSPSIVTGDKSQTYIIAHEIMHSWMGNSVSIKSFEHFWLKEAFTVYLERLATSSINKSPLGARQDRDLQYLIGLQSFIDAVATMGTTNPLTKLVVNLTSVNPDEVYSVIPYEKGSLFLRYLEELFGGPDIFVKFIKSYIKHFRKKSVDTDDFKKYLTKFFKNNEGVDDIDWHTWLHKSGMPPVIPRYDTTLIEPVVDLVEAVLSGHEVTHNDIADFSVHQKIYLMQLLIEENALPLKVIHKIGKAYNLTNSQNPEITYRWLLLSLRSRDENILSEAFDFLNKVGRLKYVQPLYKELHSWSDIRPIARENFLDHERYMSFGASNILRRTLGVDLKE